MVTEDQSEVIELLAAPSTHGGATVERIETHASIVFLAGERAWKLKRAVKYDYLDFSTEARRRAMCEEEVRINRRAAPTLYLGVVAVTRQPDGTLVLGGPGQPIDWVIEMVRFDQEGLFDRLASRGTLDRGLMPPLARAIAQFHATAERHTDYGGASGLAWVVDGNAAGFAEQGGGILDPAACDRVTRRARTLLEQHRGLLDARRDAGHVRQCHGDLHLRNIVLIDGHPTLFDAIEFNDMVACTDVLYDLAFLLMDLWQRGLPHHANAVWNAYLRDTREFGGIPALPLFLACRAAVRAKTGATAATMQSDPRRRRELEDTARRYLAMAESLLEPPPACLVAIGGYSGSGKSSVARAVAPSMGSVPGAVVIRSDEVRKQLCGVDPLQALGPDGYTPAMTRQVYAIVTERATAIAAGGHAVIVDAVCARPEDRERFERAAASAGVRFAGIWLDAPESVLVSRSARRTQDASDADAAVIRDQLRSGPGTLTWSRLDASGPLHDVSRSVADALRARLPGGVVRHSPSAALVDSAGGHD